MGASSRALRIVNVACYLRRRRGAQHPRFFASRLTAASDREVCQPMSDDAGPAGSSARAAHGGSAPTLAVPRTQYATSMLSGTVETFQVIISISS